MSYFNDPCTACGEDDSDNCKCASLIHELRQQHNVMVRILQEARYFLMDPAGRVATPADVAEWDKNARAALGVDTTEER